MKRIRILHVVPDDKFIDGPLSKFEEDRRFDNKYVMMVDSPDYRIKLIKNSTQIKLLYNTTMIKEELQRVDYDVVFFYSLTDYHLINYIPDDKIVIWWGWGFDVYGKDRYIDIPLYKPITQHYINEKISFIGALINHVKSMSLYYYLRDGNRKKAIKRIDYFYPVIHAEYELMQKVEGFRAHEFYSPGRGNYSTTKKDETFPYHRKSIVIGNSATETNNHLDAWNIVKKYVSQDTTVFFPINYGNMEYADMLTREIRSDANNLVFIREFLPKEDYFEIVDTCSYAIFGVLRQQAMGNIYRCLAKGVKVFLYKDSIPYKYLKELGCVVYALEDVDENSFNKPLTIEQMKVNRQCLIKETKMTVDICNRVISEIQTKLKN